MAATRLRSRLRGVLYRAASLLPPPPPRAPWDPRGRRLSPAELARMPVSRRLAARLHADDVAAIEAALGPAESARLAAASGPERDILLLAFGVHHRVGGVLEKTGLRPDQPPAEVHAMGRGPLAAGGSYYYADLVVDALAAAGVEPAPGMRALDFGCSSGRVVRVLAAAFPDVAWVGCDPNAAAIEWARAHLPGIDFEVSRQRPPLAHPDASFRAIFAISIWSHFAPAAALRWLDEMRRLLEPGGALVLTAHGLTSVAHAARTDDRSDHQLGEIATALYRDGFWYRSEWSHGDHGVADPDWGAAFLTPEWLLGHACPAWTLRDLRSGGVEEDQDLYVLQRPR